MRFRFENDELEKLYYENEGAGKYPEAVVAAFFRRMEVIKGASNENDLRAIKGNHFEKLGGEENTYSIRLNLSYRLIFGMNKDGTCAIILIREISNHYD